MCDGGDDDDDDDDDDKADEEAFVELVLWESLRLPHLGAILEDRGNYSGEGPNGPTMRS